LLNENREHLSKYRLEQTKDCIESSEILFDKQSYKGSINRSYYATFHAIRAILALVAIDFKRHKDVIAYFNKEYVKTEIFPRELGKLIGAIQTIREKSDYDDFYLVSKEDAEKQLATAKLVTEKVRLYLEEKTIDIE
jgi:uncharacterized protein (UPF0332 family)